MSIATSIWQAAQQQAPPAPVTSEAPPPAQVPPSSDAGTPVAELDGVPLTPGIPRTSQEVQVLRARRSELSDQLISATNRRDDLVSELNELPQNLQPGVVQRIELLDARILEIEGEIATTGSQLAASTAIAQPRPPRINDGDDSEQAFVLMILLILFVAFPLTLAWARRLLRKPLPAPVESRLLTESAERLERLEHAVDSIAIEVERVSEGQRFMTRVLDRSAQLPADR